MKDSIQKNTSWIQILFWGIITVGLFFFLQKEYAYYFLYIEQFQILPITWDAFRDSIFQIQGMAFYIASFISQMFCLPYAGAFFSTLLFLIGSLQILAILKKIFPTSHFSYYIAATCPMILLLYLQLDIYYFLGGTIAFLIMLVFFYLFLCISRNSLQIVASFLFPIILFWLAGPATSLFVIGVTIWVFFQNKSQKYSCLLSIPILGLLSFASVHWAWQSEYQKILVPDVFYSDLFLATTDFTNLYLIWYTFPILLIIVGSFHKVIQIKEKWSIITTCFQLIIILCLIWGTLEKRQNPLLLTNMEQDFYLRNKEWDKIITHFSHENYDLQTLNILNLALAHKERLDEDLFKYPQHGGVSLLSGNSEKEQNIIALAELHYHIGNIGTAQRYAYEGYILSQKGNPRLLKLLVETNLIFGSYTVAEKYISILEQTLFYRKWAQEQRNFLNNDHLIEADSTYGSKRKSLKNGTNIAVSIDFKKAFEQLAVNNPQNPIPLYYLTIIYLLNKDLIGFHSLYEKYYHTEVWPQLSIRQQEAIVAWYEAERHLWIEKGISFKVEQRFLAYKEQIQKQNPYINLEKQIASSFGDTFWYYLLFQK